MEASGHLEATRLCEQRIGQLTTTGDRHVQLRKAGAEKCEGFEQVGVTLHWVQIADRNDQLIGSRQAQLFPERGLRDRHLPYAVRDGHHTISAQPHIASQVLGQDMRDGNDRVAQRRRNTQSDAAPQAFGVVATAVHREQMWDSRTAGGPRAVHGHREFMTVRQYDTVPAKRLLQPAREGRRERSIEMKSLHVHAGAVQLACEPSLSDRRNNDDILAAGSLQLSGKAGQHALRPSWTVRLDEVREAETAKSHGWRPAVHAWKAAYPIPAGTFILGSAHGSVPVTGPRSSVRAAR